jgi:hypothetical protein
LNQLANPIYFFHIIKAMNQTINIHNNKIKFLIASVAIVVALALITSPLVAMDNDAFVTKKKKGNHAEQSISQSQSSVQNALCASRGTTFLSCNNVSFHNQKNTGNNALAQDDDDDDGKDGNSADQSISQSQSSNQNSQVVSDGDTIGSGNNIKLRNQENSGDNVLAQR